MEALEQIIAVLVVLWLVVGFVHDSKPRVAPPPERRLVVDEIDDQGRVIRRVSL